MAEISQKARNSVRLQADMFRLAKRDHGLSLSALSTLTKIPASTLKGWYDGAAMPAWALGELAAAGLPEDLLSLVLDPFDRHVGTNSQEIDGCLDELGRHAAHFNAEKLEAEADGIVTPREKEGLKARARKIETVARAARSK